MSCFFFWESPLWCVGLIQLCSDYQDREFDDDWFGVTWFFDLSYLWCHTRAYPISFGGLWILTDLHDHYHLLDAHWDVDMIVTLRSLPRSIQLGLHFSTLGCHHASPSRRYILDICAWFSYRFGRPVLHVRRYMISCLLISNLSCIRCPYWGIFPFRMRFTDVHRGHVLDDRWFHDTCSFNLSHIQCHTGAYFCFGWDLRIFTEVTCSTIDDFMSFVLRTYRALDAILGHITILDEIYRSWWSCALILIRKTYIGTMIYSLSLRWFLSGASRELPS